MAPLIKLEKAKKRYLDHAFDLTIEKKDFIIISGQNGTGKTTLIQMLLGFIEPDEGMISKKKLKIGYLPERINLPLFIKVFQYLETLARIKKSELDQELLMMFNLPLFQSVHTLSKGNQQKLAIVSTFLGTPDLIILDEPLSGLDVKTCHIFKDYLKKRRDEGLSILISTHQPELFKDLCSRHIIL
ncbi:MAG: hypothetical protein CVV61_04835 [Tenericutes bacterium HGW-Tenericutes-6]|nr:MAG: hypothetical protein CVV61_04835 [Tenericutes bacterium HGW-Tenericutes-6]